MMLIQTSYYSKEKKELIDSLLGKSFGLLQRIKLKGIGSQIFILEDSPNLELTDLLSISRALGFATSNSDQKESLSGLE